MQNNTLALIKKIKAQNGKALARVIQHMNVDKTIVRILEHAGIVPVNHHIIGFLQKAMFPKTPCDSEDLVIQVALEQAKNEEERRLNQELKKLWQEQKYEEFVIKMAEKAGYFAYFVNPLSENYSEEILKERQNAPQVLFTPEEELCTFKDPFGRYKTNYILCFVHKDLIQDLPACKKALEEHDYAKLRDLLAQNVTAIPREKPLFESRDGRFSTSVMTIQIAKKGGRLFITSRYNHTLENPDTTLDCDPDRIIFGLAIGIKKALGMDFDKVILPRNFCISEDKRLMQYHKALFDVQKNCTVYFGSTCWMQDKTLIPLDPNSQVCVEDVIINLRDSTVESPVDSNLARLLNEEIIVPNDHKDHKNNAKVKRRKLSMSKDKQEIWIQLGPRTFKPFLKFHQGKITHMYLWSTKTLPCGWVKDLSKLQVCHAYALREIQGNNFRACPELTQGFFPALVSINGMCFNCPKLELNAPLLMWACPAPYVKSLTAPLRFLQNVEGVNSVLALVIGQEIQDKCVTVVENKDQTSIVANGTPIVILQNEQITHLNLPQTHYLPEETICGLQYLESFKGPNLEKVEKDNFEWCSVLTEIYAPHLNERAYGFFKNEIGPSESTFNSSWNPVKRIDYQINIPKNIKNIDKK